MSLLDVLSDAIIDACRVDEPVGAVLSGGIDSSTVVCVARRAGFDLPTFTGYYDSTGHGEGETFDERPFANLAAASEHYEIPITPEDIVEHFDDMMEAFKPPFQGSGAMGQYMVAKYVASQGISTVLSGEGGDELFGGYARLMAVAGLPLPAGYEEYTPPQDYPDNITAALQWDLDRLDDLLAVDDQACGAWGLKAVAPMTDPRVVEYALAQPATSRIGKVMLKDAVRGVVPDPIRLRRDKKGMPAPFVQWGQGPLKEFFLERIGYIPDPAKPWDRRWWYDLTAGAQMPVAA
jgi:asparagine synthase (glutamine-hydrolysing)